MDSPPDRPTLDLSAWPSPPQATPPLRPVRRKPPSRSPRRVVLALGGVAAILVVAAGISAAGRKGAPDACDSLTLRYGADVQAADQRAVDAAQAALASGTLPSTRPAPPAPARRTSAPASATTATLQGPSRERLRDAEAAVAASERQVAAAQEELARVVAEQQRSDDPALYDEQVAAAEEALSVAREQRADDRRLLAALREQARRAESSTSRPHVVWPTTPAPAATRAVVRPVASTSRAVLEERLAAAKAQQTDHLAARRTELERAREMGCPAG